MSKANQPQDTTRRDGNLTSEERETFEFLAERFEGEKVGELAELVLQSSSEEANS